jgi:hypothetical protein
VRNQHVVRRLGQNGFVEGNPLQLGRRPYLESGQRLLANAMGFIAEIFKVFA